MATTKNLTPFQESIKSYLDERAKSDETFAASYAKPKKIIEGCCKYIIAEVKKTGRHGFADEEIYGMAVHYYDEYDIKEVEADTNVSVVINKEVQLSDGDKAKLRKRAEEQYIKQHMELLAKQNANRHERRKKASVEHAEKGQAIQLDLFGGM